MEENKKIKEKNKKMKEKKKKTKEQITEEQMNEAIEKAKKDMDELMKSMQDEMGMKNVKVVQVQIPKPNFKNFVLSLIFSLLLNSLFIMGISGFYNFLNWNEIYDLLLFAAYFSLVDRIIDFLFIKFFTPLIIRSMGIATFLPSIISLAIVIIFPIFVKIDNIVLCLITLVIVSILRGVLMSFFKNKYFKKKIRRKV